jgi:hypothetical protein
MMSQQLVNRTLIVAIEGCAANWSGDNPNHRDILFFVEVVVLPSFML